jgi:hypothetical protein
MAILTMPTSYDEGDENYPHIQAVIDAHWND